MELFVRRAWGSASMQADADHQLLLWHPDSDVWRDHAPPHFHALYAEHEALINIQTLEIVEGSLSKCALALVLEWAAEHQRELVEDWELLYVPACRCRTGSSR